MTMTIKSFKEHAQVNELAPLALVPAAVGMAVRAAPTIARSAVANADKVGAALSVATGAAKKGYSAVKKFVKREETDIDEKMNPKKHVGKSKKNPDMYCVFDKDGKEVKLFKDKKDAEEYAVKNHDELMGEGLWDNIHKKRERIKRGSGETMRKKGDKGAPKSLDVGEGFASDAQRRAAFASGYKAKGKKEGAMSRIDYQTKSGEKGTGVSTFKKKPISSDYKPFPKAGKKPLHGDNVAEISRDDMVKKVSSTIGSKAPMMINPQNKEKNKIKTGLDRLRKALGPNHVMNQRA